MESRLSQAIRRVRQTHYEILCAKSDLPAFNECVNRHIAAFGASASQNVVNEFVYNRDIYHCLMQCWLDSKLVLSSQYDLYLPSQPDIGSRHESRPPLQLEGDSAFQSLLSFMEFIGSSILNVKRLRVRHETVTNTFFDLRDTNCRNCRRKLGTVYFCHESQKFKYESLEELDRLFEL